MKRTLIFLALAAAFTACNNESKAKEKKPATSGQETGRYTALLNEFEPMSFDTLEVFNEKTPGRFQGKELDSAFASLFPEKVRTAYFERDQGIFACYRFVVDDNRTALIARTPGEYSPTSVKLFIYDKRSDALTDYIELANFWGDAGDVSDKVSWLFKSDENKVQLYLSAIQSHDNSIENPGDKSVKTHSSNYLIQLSKTGFDTISRDPKLLAGKFRRVPGKR